MVAIGAVVLAWGYALAKATDWFGIPQHLVDLSTRQAARKETSRFVNSDYAHFEVPVVVVRTKRDSTLPATFADSKTTFTEFRDRLALADEFWGQYGVHFRIIDEIPMTTNEEWHELSPSELEAATSQYSKIYPGSLIAVLTERFEGSDEAGTQGLQREIDVGLALRGEIGRLLLTRLDTLHGVSDIPPTPTQCYQVRAGFSTT